MTQPEVDLDQISHHLRACHELAVPGLSIVRGHLKETFRLFSV